MTAQAIREVAADPDHFTGDGPLGLVDDPGCWMCREITAQPAATATSGGGS